MEDPRAVAAPYGECRGRLRAVGGIVERHRVKGSGFLKSFHVPMTVGAQIERAAAAWQAVTLADAPLVPEPVRSSGTAREVVEAALVRVAMLRMVRVA